MVDIVANHMGNTNTDYHQNNPFNESSHYHDWCEISSSDFSSHNQHNIENCRLAKLADLKQEDSWVRSTLKAWIKGLIKVYKIDGLRIDTVPEVPKSFWAEFTKESGVYTVGEVFDGDMGYVSGLSLIHI